ncbi:MAG: hypothetical protein PHR28_10595 [candidate division Zixibacteria bacterium]|nr:hypothetical protein [candidate division Zixibacteria bacterium]
MEPISSNDRNSHEIQITAWKTAERNVYSMSNPYTDMLEKYEIEHWYQFPINFSGIALMVSSVFWAQGLIGWWEAMLAAIGAGIIAGIFNWFFYIRLLVFGFNRLFDSPKIEWFIHIGVAAIFGFSGHWVQAICLFGNRLLFLFPTGFGAMMTYAVLSSRKYKMHPKYAFLKRVYGKSYPFE